MASRLLLALLCLVLAGCATQGHNHGGSPLAGAEQLVLVTTPGWDAPTGELRRFEREGAGWREVESAIPVTVGRAGSAWGLGLHPAQAEGPQKREGDGRSPAGVFAVGTAFGYPPSVDTGLAYEAMDAGDWCVDVPGSPYYNRLVDQAQVGSEAVKDSSEPMRRDLHVHGDQRYRIGFVIEHNPAGADRAGSCIFAHVWKSPADATAGCTAMDDAALQSLLRWLDRRREPRFVLLPRAEYERLRAVWMLP
jgi:L,D-peptidoglycan transpeptidase YkuD (ErfK/YbiS/YcfS/YnhG family)